MGNYRVRKIALDGVLVGLYLVFALLPLRFGDFLVIGLGSIVITLAAVAFSPLDAVIIAILGETISQIFFSGYGITPTTPLWVMPVALRGLVIGIVAWLYRRKADDLTKHKVIYFITLMGTALLISLVDTGVLYLDGMIMGYPVAYTWAKTALRFGTSQLTAVVVALLVLPLYKAVNYVIPRPKKNITTCEEKEK